MDVSLFIILLLLSEINYNSNLFSMYNYSCIATSKICLNKTIDTKKEILNSNIDQNLYKLDPWWITGFCDGEASFSISISFPITDNGNWSIKPSFAIHLHKKDIKILELIKFYFDGIGNIGITQNSAIYRVRNIEDLLIIKSHFMKYPLQTSKFNNFYIFYKVLDLVSKKTHLNNKGFLEIASLVNRLNKPLSPSLIEKIGVLPTIELDIPDINLEPELNPWWITGFCDGEASFTYFKKTRVTAKNEERLDFRPIFEVSQHKKDLYILNSILNFFKSGNVVSGGKTEKSVPRVRITGIDNLKNIIIVHFSNYPLQSFKVFNYNIWVEIIDTLYLNPDWSKERELKILSLTNKLNK